VYWTVRIDPLTFPGLKMTLLSMFSDWMQSNPLWGTIWLWKYWSGHWY